MSDPEGCGLSDNFAFWNPTETKSTEGLSPKITIPNPDLSLSQIYRDLVEYRDLVQILWDPANFRLDLDGASQISMNLTKSQPR